MVEESARPMPEHTARLMAQVGGFGLSPEQYPCEGAVFHSPRPLTVRQYVVDPTGLVVPDGGVEAEAVVKTLCPTCAANLTVMLKLLAANGGKLPWLVRREFGNIIRSIAMGVWDI